MTTAPGTAPEAIHFCIDEEPITMPTTAKTPPDDQAWRSTLAKAAARKTLAEADFLTTVAAMTERVSQTEMAAVLHTSQANVSRWAARGREHAQRRRAGRLGADPYEIAQRYALGQIPRDEMIAALAAWPYGEDFVPSNYWDDIGVSPQDSFSRTVGRAFDDGLLSDEDYDAILDAMAD
jgi:hypothetical protein